MRTATATGKYVYCIIPSAEPRSFGPIGIGGRGDEVYTVHQGGLAAVVSDSPLTVYDPTPENALAHETVNQTALRQYSVMPLAFGTLFRSEEDILELLKKAEEPLRQSLQKVEGKVEIQLTATWDPEQVMRRIQQQYPAIPQAAARIQAAGQAGYFDQIELGRVIEAAFKKEAEGYVGQILEAVKPYVVDSRLNDPVGDKTFLNAALLVRRENQDKLLATGPEIGARLGSDISVRFTGPWPAYNFVRILLKAKA